jgi:AcrR family transcriptional regulator
MEHQDIPGFGLPEKEEKILKSAIRIFSEKGFSASTTSEIAKDAGVAEGTIFRYFKTKKDILRGILIQGINLVSGKIIMDGVEKILNDPGQKELGTVIKELIYDRLKLVDTFFPLARVIMTEAVFHDDVREAIYNNVVVKALDTFRRFHAKMAERGMIRQDVNPDLLFRTILANTAGLIAQRKLLGNRFPTEELDIEIDRMLDVMLFGIVPQKTDRSLEV